jgi:hypothetical protein
MHKLLLALICLNAPVFGGDEWLDELLLPERPSQPAPAPLPAWKQAFEYRLGTLRGASLQPASGVQGSSGAQAGVGLQPSAAHRGAAPAMVRPMSDEEWRKMFPKKLGTK